MVVIPVTINYHKNLIMIIIMTSMVRVSYESVHGSQHGNGEPRPVTYQTLCLAEV